VPLEDLIARPITGIRPFNELPVDAEIWREAHQQHHVHRQLHAVAAHRPGIVFGLEVVASRSEERTVVVSPGVGIDADGRTVVLSGQPGPVPLTLVETGRIYIILSFLRAADSRSAIMVGGGQQHYREVEGQELKQVKELPSTPYLELARIFRSSPDAPVRNAALPFAPGNDELNLLFRTIAFPHCHADIGVGELSYVPTTSASPWNPNRAGLWYLLREGNACGFHLRYTGPINLRASAPHATAPAVLYVAGQHGFQPLTDAEVDGLRRFLDGGGLLFGEAKGGSDDFGQGFQELAGKLGATLSAVGPGHPLLTAHHVFSAPPLGAQSRGSLSMDSEAGVLFGTYDYGAAWQGEIEAPDATAARERIRQAQEFGLNVLAFAARRRRLRELSALG
jgi:hypothetical protein